MLVAQGRVLCWQVFRMMTASCLSKGCANFPEFLWCLWFLQHTHWCLVSYPHLSHWHILAFDYGWYSLVCFSRGTQERTVAGDDASLSLSLIRSFFYSVRGQMTSSLLLWQVQPPPKLLRNPPVALEQAIEMSMKNSEEDLGLTSLLLLCRDLFSC